MKAIKTKLIFISIVILTAAGLSTALILAYLSDQRWTAFGTVGTWITGGSAALIAYSQHREQRIREAELTFKSISGIKNDVSRISERLLNLLYCINDEVEACLSKNATKNLSPSLSRFKKQLDHYCSLIKTVNLEQAQKNHLPPDVVNNTNELNHDVENFLAQIQSCISNDPHYPRNVFSILPLSIGFNQLISSIIHSIDDQNLYLSFLEQQLNRACELDKKRKTI